MFSDSADASLNLGGVESQPGPVTRAHPHLSLRGAAVCLLTDGRAVDLEAKDALLLAFLAIEGQTARATLAERLWPDADAERARGNLRARLMRMKQRVGAELIGPGAHATLAAGITHDLEDDSELLTPIALDEAGGFAEWLETERLARKARRGEKLAAASAQAEAAGQLAAALEHAQALIALDALSEHAHRRVMRLHYLRGDQAAARAAYQRCAELLRRELNALPSEETAALLRQIETSAAPQPARAPLPVTVLRPPRLVGRESEAAAIAAAWREGQPVLVLGEAGMGKSRLLAEFTDAASVAVAARPGDGTVPFAAAARLLRAVIAHSPAAAPPASRAQLAVLLPEYAERETGPAANLAKLAQVVQEVLDAAEAAGVAAVLLDDLHFADDATLDLLREILGGEQGTLRWAFAQRPAEMSATAQKFVDGLSLSRRLVSVPLAPLSVEAMAALIDSLGVAQLDAAKLAPALVRHTGGNPLFALETIKQMLVDGATRVTGATHLPAPTSVGALIGHRLKQLSPRALALARLGAVAGPDFSARLAERILGTSALDLADAWGELEAAQVLRDAAFAHDLVYEATLAGVPSAIARELHARVADELEAHAAPAERIAAHRLAAADARKSIPALRAAAASALAKFQRPLAAQWLEQAARLLEEVGDRSGAFAVLTEAVTLRQSFDTGATHEASTQWLLELADSPAQRAEALTHRSIYLHILGRSEEAVPLLDEGIRAALAAEDEVAAMRVLNVHGIVLRRLGRNDEAVVMLRDALVLARRTDAAGDDLPAILNNLALAQMEADDPVAAILHFEEAARLQPDTLTRARVLNNLALSFEEIGSLDRALETRLSAQRLLRGQDGADFARLNLLISLASGARYLQRYSDALNWLEQAQALAASMTHWRVEDLQIQRAMLWVDLGAWRAADDAFEAIEAGRALPAPVRAGVLLARAYYQIARNLDTSATIAQAEKLLADVDERRIWRRIRIVKARCLPPDQARLLAEAELEREAMRGNRAAQIPYATLAARAHLALGDPQTALRLARRAVEGMKAAVPAGFSPLEVRYTLCEALAAVDDESAALEIQKLAADLEHIAAAQVPEAHRATFLRGVMLNRNIRAAAERAAGRSRLRLLKR